MSSPYILISRPSDSSAEHLTQLLDARGIRAVHLPLLAYQPLQPKPGSYRADLAIFTSAEAVRGWHRAQLKLEVAQLWAVGPATAAQLSSIGLQAKVPPAASSEGLLEALPQNLQDKQVLVIKGRGGRRLLARECRQRGARVRSLLTYAREPLAIRKEDLPQPWPPALCWLSSGDLVRAFAQLELEAPVAVPSARVARIARGCGYRVVYNLRAADNNSFVKFALTLWQQQQHSLPAQNQSKIAAT